MILSENREKLKVKEEFNQLIFNIFKYTAFLILPKYEILTLESWFQRFPNVK